MAVEDDLCPERRMASHFDGDVAPVRIKDVKRVVLDIRRLLRQTNGTTAPMLDVPDGSYRPCDQDQEQPPLDGMCGEVLLSNLVLALSASAVDDRNPVRLGGATHPPTETTGHTHQVGIVEFLFRAHESSPPLAEATARIAQPEVPVQDDAINAVIASVQQVTIALAQLVGHQRRVNRPAPSGATPSGGATPSELFGSATTNVDAPGSPVRGSCTVTIPSC